MKRRGQIAIFVIIALVIAGTVILLLAPKKNITPTNNENGDGQIANPASVYCIQQGYNLSIRADEEGAQYGVCIFNDGSECDEWTFYRGECRKGEQFNITK